MYSDCYRKLFVIDEETCMVNIIDTAGQEEFKVLREQHIKFGDGYIIVYSIDKRDSFIEVPAFINEILETKMKQNCPMVICGNKCDLTIDREIAKEEGLEIAQKYNVPFYETSALSNTNVSESFFQCVREIRKEQLDQTQKKKKTFSFCFLI